jgi:hypothetical protein
LGGASLSPPRGTSVPQLMAIWVHIYQRVLRVYFELQ